MENYYTKKELLDALELLDEQAYQAGLSKEENDARWIAYQKLWTFIDLINFNETI